MDEIGRFENTASMAIQRNGLYKNTALQLRNADEEYKKEQETRKVEKAKLRTRIKKAKSKLIKNLKEDYADSKASTQEIIDRSVKSAYTQGEPSTFSKLSDHPSRKSRQSAPKPSPTLSQSKRHRDGNEDQFTTYTTLVKDGTQVERIKPFVKLSSIDPSYGFMIKNLQLSIPMGAKTPGPSPLVSAGNRRGSVKEKKDANGGHHLRTGSKSVSQPVSKLGSRRSSQKDILVLLPEVENEDSDDLELEPTDKWADFELGLDNIKSPDQTHSPKAKETANQYGSGDSYSSKITLGYGQPVLLAGKGKLSG
jgi:hypothetical protein